FAPRMSAYMTDTKTALLNHNARLHDNFSGGAWASAEFFLSSHKSPPRLDDLDLLWGWCALTSLGNYNPRWGEELILWDEQKVIKFPPGSTFLFLAAFMRYSYTQVRAGEKQYAFDQYLQAGLFRFVESDFRSEASFEATAWKPDHDAREKLRQARMATALGMYSHVSEL
ncbi:hypothetical protein DFH09DRAFT_936612, partial [Mycena vulgaris]